MAAKTKKTKRPRKKNAKQAWYDKKYSTIDVALKALNGVNQIRKLINVERKYHDQTATTAISTTAQVVHLSGIAQGDTVTDRDGNSIKPQYMKVNFVCHASSAAGQSLGRILIVRDKQQEEDAAPLITDVLDSASLTSQLHYSHKQRFNILYDFGFATNNSGGDPTTFYKSFTLPMTGHIRYNGTASTDIQKSGLYLMYFGNQGTNTSSMDFKSRLVFTDN